MKAVARVFFVTGTVQLMEPVVIPLVYLLHAPAKPRAGAFSSPIVEKEVK